MRPFKVYIHNYLNPLSPVTWLAKGIQCFYSISYNHVGTVIVEDGVWYIIHAIGKGVVKEDFWAWVGRERRGLRYEPYESIFTDQELTGRANYMVGKPYNKISYWDQIYFRITGKWKGKTGKEAEESVNCYQLKAFIGGEDEFWMAHPTMKTV